MSYCRIFIYSICSKYRFIILYLYVCINNEYDSIDFLNITHISIFINWNLTLDSIKLSIHRQNWNVDVVLKKHRKNFKKEIFLIQHSSEWSKIVSIIVVLQTFLVMWMLELTDIIKVMSDHSHCVHWNKATLTEIILANFSPIAIHFDLCALICS